MTQGAENRALTAHQHPLPSASLSCPWRAQDAAAQPKRVAVGHTVALRFRPRPYLTPESKKQVQPSSGCRQDGDFGSTLSIALCLSYLLAAHPRRRGSTQTSRRRAHGSAMAPPLSVSNTDEQETG